MVILGGNMRFKACKEAGLKEVPIIKASGLSTEKQREFLIKDNLAGGEWDWTLLQEWDSIELGDWGLDIPNWSAGMDVNNMTDEDVDIEEEFDPIGVASGLQRVVFIFDGPEEAESWLSQHPKLPLKKQNMAWQIDLSTIKMLENEK